MVISKTVKYFPVKSNKNSKLTKFDLKVLDTGVNQNMRVKRSPTGLYKHKLYPQSSTLYIYYIYIELASTQSPFFQNLPYECTASVLNQNKDIEFWLSAHIVRAYPYMELTNTKDEQMTSRCMQRFVTFKILYN